jgi:hypothetical protein
LVEYPLLFCGFGNFVASKYNLPGMSMQEKQVQIQDLWPEKI